MDYGTDPFKSLLDASRKREVKQTRTPKPSRDFTGWESYDNSICERDRTKEIDLATTSWINFNTFCS